MKHLIFLLPAFLLLGSTTLFAQKMDNKKLSNILEQEADSVSGETGYWQLIYKESIMIVITDEQHNRMRMITPISYLKDLEESTYQEALKANFHTALDVKYAISDDIMWSVFIHPLKELTENQVKDAMKQVYFAAMTFGGSYTSTDLVFPAAEDN